jgi:hypothetical protein
LVTEDRAAALAKGQAREVAPISLWSMTILAMLPFPLAAGVYGYGPRADARPAVTVLLTWSAMVLCFLAGVRWGLESSRRVPRRERLAGAFLFAVVSWALLLFRWRLNLVWTLIAYLAAFMLQWLSDHLTPHSQARFPRLSTAVTASACISLAVALDQAIRSAPVGV